MTTATKPQAEPTCPKCGGRLWDNRLSKKNPKAPDWKCRDKACDGVIWPPRPNGRQAKPDVSRSSSSIVDPYETDDLPGEPPPVEEAYREEPSSTSKLDALFQLYDVCYHHAEQLARKSTAAGLEPDVSAMCATIFIQATQRGITV